MASPSVTSIGEWCFINSSLDSLVFPASLSSVGKYAFTSNNSLKSVTFLSSSRVSIGEEAFSNCSNLVSVTIFPSSGFSIGINSFARCSNLVSLRMYSPSVDSIGERAFQDCVSLASLTMPSSLTSIGIMRFSIALALTLLHFFPPPELQ